MSDNKKYYYLRVKENFYDSDEMIILESMPDGFLYSNILIKLYLRSLKNNGKLMFNDRIPFNSEMLSKITRHPVAVVEKAVSIFKEMNLIDVLDNGAIFMLDIESFIGKSNTEADRKRNYRRRIEQEKQKLSLGHLSGQMSDEYPPEIEIEKEIDIEKEIEIEIEIEKDTLKIIADEYQSRIAPLDGIQFETLKDFITLNGMEPDVILKAISLAADNGKRNFSYIRAILQNWKNDGLLSIAAVNERERKYQESKTKG
ncbi:phage replisome organizer N-terminal domain-containing protein, partial [Salmonella enterica]|nr:phage replisome organizer N-terminal domain-containing protein [Salmonella enterica]